MGWDPPLVAEPGADTGDVVSLRPLVAPFVLPSRRRLGLAEAALAGAKEMNALLIDLHSATFPTPE